VLPKNIVITYNLMTEH